MQWLSCSHLSPCEPPNNWLLRGRKTNREFRDESRVRSFTAERSSRTRYMSLAFALGKIVLQRAIVQRLAAGALEPSHIAGVFHALKEFFVVLYGNDDGDRFAFARHDF